MSVNVKLFHQIEHNYIWQSRTDFVKLFESQPIYLKCFNGTYSDIGYLFTLTDGIYTTLLDRDSKDQTKFSIV